MCCADCCPYSFLFTLCCWTLVQCCYSQSIKTVDEADDALTGHGGAEGSC